MGFAESHATQENDIGQLFDKLQPEQLLNLEAVYFFRPSPIELIQGFDYRKACQANAALS